MRKLNAAQTRYAARTAAGIASIVLAGILTGCAGITAPTAQDAEVLGLAGNIHGGNQPITGSTIAVFTTSVAPTPGAGAPVTMRATTQSGANGAWNITGSYTCPAGDEAYVVAGGGNPGLASGTDNSALFLVAAIGPCGTSSVTPTTYVTINEATTVAAAYALSGFAPVGGAGMTRDAIRSAAAGILPNTVTAGFASSVNTTTNAVSNAQGISDAFANATNIVSSNTGVTYATTPANANGVVPTAIINALADILQDCVNSTDPSSAACMNLFAAAKPPTGSAVAAPVNVFQAALDIAQYPANNPGGLFALISSQSAFPATAITAAPNDWSIGVSYTNSLLVSGTGLGINAQDQVFVSGAGYLIDFSPAGAPLTTTNLLAGASAITTTDTLREIAFDTAGNLFVTDGAYTGVYKYNPTTTAVTALNFNVAPVSETNSNTYGLAVDALGDVWTTSYSKSTCPTVTCTLIEFASGTSYSPYSSFSGNTVGQPTGAVGGSRGTAFDVKTGNIWISAIDDNLGELFKVTPSATGAAAAAAPPTQLIGLGSAVTSGTDTNNTGYGTISVAVDSSSRAWFVTAGGPAATGSHATTAVSASLTPVTSAGVVGTSITGGGLNTPFQVVIDGNNNLFVANGSGASAGGSVVGYSPSLGAFLGTNGISPNTTYVPTAGTYSPIAGVGSFLYEPSYLAVDRSGALWVLSSGNGTSHPANLVQILGVAAPVNPVLAAGQYGVKP